jgi:hypothetical protein
MDDGHLSNTAKLREKKTHVYQGFSFDFCEVGGKAIIYKKANFGSRPKP